MPFDLVENDHYEHPDEDYDGKYLCCRHMIYLLIADIPHIILIQR